MAGYNRVILLGNLTRDPQLRYLPNNTAVCDFGLAMNRRYKDRDGNQKEEVCFVDVEAFARQAEVINQYMTKGRPLLVEGRLRFDSWTGQDGQKHSKLRVIVDNFQFVGGRGDQPSGGGVTYDRGAAPQGRPQPSPSPEAPLPSEPDEVPPAGDNIPF